MFMHLINILFNDYPVIPPLNQKENTVENVENVELFNKLHKDLGPCPKKITGSIDYSPIVNNTFVSSERRWNIILPPEISYKQFYLKKYNYFIVKKAYEKDIKKILDNIYHHNKTYDSEYTIYNKEITLKLVCKEGYRLSHLDYFSDLWWCEYYENGILIKKEDLVEKEISKL